VIRPAVAAAVDPQAPAAPVAVATTANRWLAALQPLVAPLLAGLELQNADSQTRRLVFASARAGDGTTTLAASAAYGLARDFGRRVVLVEANVVRPRLAQRLGIEETPGLVEVVRGTPAQAALRRVDPALPLEVLPAGSRGARPTLLLHDRSDAALDELAAGRDQVVVDLPPLLESVEGRALVRRGDVVVFVVRAGATRRDDVKSALEQLRESGARVAGVVLNRCDRRHTR
jgi:Mrp family chromosome partitioning ATPase